jgi:hypothetical protein
MRQRRCWLGLVHDFPFSSLASLALTAHILRDEVYSQVIPVMPRDSRIMYTGTWAESDGHVYGGKDASAYLSLRGTSLLPGSRASLLNQYEFSGRHDRQLASSRESE